MRPDFPVSPNLDICDYAISNPNPFAAGRVYVRHVDIPHIGVRGWPAAFGSGDFHCDRTVDGDRISLHLGSEGDRPRQGSFESEPAGSAIISGPASGGDARLRQDSSRNRQLFAAGVYAVSYRDPAYYFSDRSTRPVFWLAAAASR